MLTTRNELAAVLNQMILEAATDFGSFMDRVDVALSILENDEDRDFSAGELIAEMVDFAISEED